MTNNTFPADLDTNSPGWQFVSFARFEATIPEPGSWAMLIAGFGLTGACHAPSPRRHGLTARTSFTPAAPPPGRAGR